MLPNTVPYRHYCIRHGQVHAEKRRVAEIDKRQAYRAQGCRSTSELLARRLGLTRAEANTHAATAAGLDELPRTAAQLRTGQLGAGQAKRPPARKTPRPTRAPTSTNW